jgi:hypothetical protein
MVEAIYLAALAILLAGFLFWKKVPRPIAVDIWCGTILVFIICLWISLEIFGRFAGKFEEGIFPYLPPIIPMLVFLVWWLRRIRRRR